MLLFLFVYKSFLNAGENIISFSLRADINRGSDPLPSEARIQVQYLGVQGEFFLNDSLKRVTPTPPEPFEWLIFRSEGQEVTLTQHPAQLLLPAVLSLSHLSHPRQHPWIPFPFQPSLCSMAEHRNLPPSFPPSLSPMQLLSSARERLPDVLGRERAEP